MCCSGRRVSAKSLWLRASKGHGDSVAASAAAGLPQGCGSERGHSGPPTSWPAERREEAPRNNGMAVSGCDDSAGAWLAAYQAPLVGFVLPIVNGDRQAAEDVVQETMLRGWQHAGDLSPDHAGSWLRQVARNIAISTYHRRRRARPPEVPLEETTEPATSDGIDGIADALLIASALNSLSPDHRRVIVELFYNQRQVAEVAAMLAIPEGTVRSRCFYGLRVLRRALEKQGVTRP